MEWVEGGAVRRTRCAHVIVAVPASAARQIIKDLPGAVADGFGAVQYGPYVVAAPLTAERSAIPWGRHLRDGDTWACVQHVVQYRQRSARAGCRASLGGGGRRSGGVARRPGGSLMIYGASNLARRLLDRTDGQVRHVFMRDLAAIFPELPGPVTEMQVQRWPEGIPFSAPGRHRWQPALEQPVGRVHLAGDCLGARGRTLAPSPATKPHTRS